MKVILDGEPGDSREDRHRERARIASRKRSVDSRDIGPVPAVVNPERREACWNNWELALTTYFPEAFPLPFSDDHKEVIGIIQDVATNGGQFALAMPRGSGKTTIATGCVILSILTRRRRFAVVISSTAEAATDEIIADIKVELTYNELLYEDFPDVIHGIPQLELDNKRSLGQMVEGEKTLCKVGRNKIVFPTLAGNPNSGAVIQGAGLLGRIRGMKHALKDGTKIRPDFVLPDDPQTEESADAPPQTTKRARIISGAVLGLAGPKKKVAAVMLCTAMRPNDLTERTLASPHWRGKRTKMLVSFPTNMKWWEDYLDFRSECTRTGQPVSVVNQRYIENRAEADEGAAVSWVHRFNEEEISAIQSAMHLWYKDASIFAAEYQNEPTADVDDTNTPSCDLIASKTINLRRGMVPKWATKMTAFVDVHLEALYWMICAWSDDFTGHVVDYGIYPSQNRSYIALREVTETLQKLSGSSQPQGAIRWGLDGIVALLSEKKDGERTGFATEDGRVLQISKIGIDQQYQTDTVHEMILRSKHAAILTPTQGRGIKAGNSPMESWAKKPNEHIGYHWTRKWGEARRATYHKIDTNFWKTFACERVAAQLGESGCLSVFGDRPETHKLLREHCISETAVKTFRADGSLLWEWQDPVAGRDNHWFDCLSNNFAMASILDCKLANASPSAKQKRRVFSLPGAK